MPSDAADPSPTRPQNLILSSHPPPKITESPPCPRCDSTNTKFCYYNNYNLSQPRHFCKSCRRYWTRGGTLRNIPVGGGTRKATKRTRPCSSSSPSPSSSTVTVAATSPPSSSTLTHEPVNPVSVLPCVKTEMDYDRFVPVGMLNMNMQQQGQHLLALGGYGGYVGSGFEGLELGYGGNRFWEVPVPVAGHGFVVDGGGGVVGRTAVNNTWQVMGDEEGGNDGLVNSEDCFAWSGLAIGKGGLK